MVAVRDGTLGLDVFGGKDAVKDDVQDLIKKIGDDFKLEIELSVGDLRMKRYLLL